MSAYEVLVGKPEEEDGWEQVGERHEIGKEYSWEYSDIGKAFFTPQEGDDVSGATKGIKMERP
jgi:hypothetical protein